MRKMIVHSFALLAVVAVLAGCRKAEVAPTSIPDVVVAHSATLPSEPDDRAWDAAPEHVATLLLQDLVDPRLMEPSTAEIRVRALSDGRRLAFRLEWADETLDDTRKPARFTDACAVQLPAKIEATVPSPQMGEEGRPVQIIYWSAAWQAVVDGRADSLENLYPNATVDHYPFEAQSLESGSRERHEMANRYAPARALGNTMAGPRETPVQDLIAEGPGTLTPAPESISTGSGKRLEGGWSVVVSRPLPEGFQTQPQSQVSFAVWQGSHEEVGSQKMRTGWVTLTKQEKP
jgi:DMSO reductase family type II enzyme heme b subunit